MNITVNGQQYDDWASIPPDVKQTLAQTLPDMNRNGVPDLFEQPQGASSFTSVAINVNGQTYTSAAEMPPEMQEMLRQALGGLTGLTGSAVPPAQPGAAPAQTAPLPPDHVLLNGVPTPVEEKPKKKRWWQRG